MICKAKSAHRAEPQISEPAILLPGWKRALDLTFCLVALPVLAIATLGVVVLTSLASPGPVFFRQERIGWRGRKFQLYKFRTMHVSSNVTAHQTHFSELMRANTPMQKLDARGDKRVIPGGSLLRASGLDELPQLINVLRGEMSLVGPRPSLPYECEQYAPHHRRRLECVPGLTGLWQVSGKNRTTFEEMVQLDVEYVSRRSVALDLKIMARTLPVVLGQVV
ncbi:MAG: sugar transferase, partial [Opitutaceae bacterium]